MLEGTPAPVTPRTLYRVVLLVFALLVVILLFSEFIGLVLLLLLAAIVAVPLSAAADRLERVHVPRAVGVPVTLLCALAVIAGIVALLVPTFIQEGTRFVDALPQTVRSLDHAVSHATSGRRTTNAGHDIQKWVDGFTKSPQRLFGPATTVVSTLSGAVTAALVVLFTALFAAIYPESLYRGIVRLAPPRHRAHAQQILGRLATAYLGWLAGLAVGMTVLGTLTYAGLSIVGLPFALVFAVLTALASVVPYYGALLSYVPPRGAGRDHLARQGAACARRLPDRPLHGGQHRRAADHGARGQAASRARRGRRGDRRAARRLRRPVRRRSRPGHRQDPRRGALGAVHRG